jgi:DNA-directed RNA polymerase II subunit RPB2
MIVQRIVEDSPAVELQTELQHATGEIETPKKFSLKFGQIYLSKPTHWEKDGAPTPLMPNEVFIFSNIKPHFSFLGAPS